MKIITLVENSFGHEDCIAEHGLSIYIETEKHKLLLDTGQTDAAVKNVIENESLFSRTDTRSESFNVIGFELVAHLADDDPQRADVFSVFRIV